MLNFLSLELAGWASSLNLCGDLNLHLEGDFDITGGGPYLGKKIKVFKATQGLVLEYRLVDLWYAHRRNVLGNTFYSAPHRKHVRLDCFFMSVEIAKDVKIEIAPRIISDQNPVISEINFNLQVKPKTWTFESNLLLDPDYFSRMNNWITEFFQINRGSASDLIVWDTFKAGVRGENYELFLGEAA